jgi:hypothetical protein
MCFYKQVSRILLPNSTTSEKYKIHMQQEFSPIKTTIPSFDLCKKSKKTKSVFPPCSPSERPRGEMGDRGRFFGRQGTVLCLPQLGVLKLAKIFLKI